jgi:hypothetical protein
MLLKSSYSLLGDRWSMVHTLFLNSLPLDLQFITVRGVLDPGNGLEGRYDRVLLSSLPLKLIKIVLCFSVFGT